MKPTRQRSTHGRAYGGLALGLAAGLLALAAVAVFAAPRGFAPEAQASLPAAESGVPAAAVTLAPSAAAATTTVYLPSVLDVAPVPNVFGVTMLGITEGFGLPDVRDTATAWVRGPFIPWDAVQPASPAAMDWTSQAALDAQLINAANDGIEVILGVSRTPAWAQDVPGKTCGPIKAENLDEFANFMQAAVARYSAPPYNVKYWEIWNEPDVAYQLVAADSPFGCWGDANDPYYGGGYYADVLAAIYPKMKQANPNVQVLIGGLLLDCNPSNCTPGKYLEGILRDGGGAYFDGVSFHAYDYYGAPYGYANAGWNTAYNSTGPALKAKADHIKAMLAQYNARGKFLMNTEAALVLPYNQACNDTCEEAKARYVAQSYAMAIGEGLVANVWFSLHGWRESELVDPVTGARLPAYGAYQFAAAQLNQAHVRGRITQYPGIMGYEFEAGLGRLWVVWSLDGADHVLNLPGVPAAVYDPDGTPLPAANPLTIGGEPRYIQWAP